MKKRIKKKEKELYFGILLLGLFLFFLTFAIHTCYIIYDFQEAFKLESRRARNFCKQQGYWGGFINYGWYPEEKVEVHCYGAYPENKTENKTYTMEEMWLK